MADRRNKMNFWQALFRGLFLFASREQEEEQIVRKNIVEPDFIDYDGMGNQGRFMKKTSKKRKKK